MADRELIGIDVGGTFTDFVHLRDGSPTVHKTPTTADDQSRAVETGLTELEVGEDAAIAHGTTTATNALLERRGARCALVTTEGFRDVLEIGRQNRPQLYALSQERPPPLVPAELRLEISERVASDGTVLREPSKRDVDALVDHLRELRVESVAIVLLFSYRHPDHERLIARAIREALPDVSVSLSSEILPEYREYERTSTTVVNAYVQPLVRRYVERLEQVVAPRSLYIMQSNGGTIGAGQAAAQPARLVLSGPAGGVVGALRIARIAFDDDRPAIMSIDMGGTSTDVALCPGSVPTTSENSIAGLPLRLPSVDIHTVGAGGGSIARVDSAGGLHVGPASAGALPGPACYGRGGKEATVTDANLLLGRLMPDRFLGGTFTLDVQAARAAVGSVARVVDLSVEEAALGIVRIANASMERALRRVSVERGHDPKSYTLVPFGGAGPLHACEVAEAIGMSRILLPPNPGVLSALGLLTADVVVETSVSVLDRLDEMPRLHETEAERVRSLLRHEGHADPAIDAQVDVRYRGQSYEIMVPARFDQGADAMLSEAADRFHAEHERRYGHADRGAQIEIVTLRVRARAPGAAVDLPRDERRTDAAVPALKSVVVLPDGSSRSVPVYERDALGHGHAFDGPAVVTQYDSTVFVTPDWHVEVDAWRNLHLTRT